MQFLLILDICLHFHHFRFEFDFNEEELFVALKANNFLNRTSTFVFTRFWSYRFTYLIIKRIQLKRYYNFIHLYKTEENNNNSNNKSK